MALKLLDIEKELDGPDSETAFKRYDAVLAALDERVSAAVTAGLPPDEFARAERLKEANVIARKLLRLAVKEGGVPSAGTSGNFKR